MAPKRSLGWGGGRAPTVRVVDESWGWWCRCSWWRVLVRVVARVVVRTSSASTMAVISPVLFEPCSAPKNIGDLGFVTTGPYSSAT